MCNMSMCCQEHVNKVEIMALAKFLNFGICAHLLNSFYLIFYFFTIQNEQLIVAFVVIIVCILTSVYTNKVKLLHSANSKRNQNYNQKKHFENIPA